MVVGERRREVRCEREREERERERGVEGKTRANQSKKKCQPISSLTWPAQFAEGPGEALVGIESTSALRG